MIWLPVSLSRLFCLLSEKKGHAFPCSGSVAVLLVCEWTKNGSFYDMFVIPQFCEDEQCMKSAGKYSHSQLVVKLQMCTVLAVLATLLFPFMERREGPLVLFSKRRVSLFHMTTKSFFPICGGEKGFCANGLDSMG